MHSFSISALHHFERVEALLQHVAVPLSEQQQVDFQQAVALTGRLQFAPKIKSALLKVHGLAD